MTQTTVIQSTVREIVDRALREDRLNASDGYALINVTGPDLVRVMHVASELSDSVRPHRRVTYSRKVFLPLTNMCQDRCGYCTFVKGPNQRGVHSMTPHEVLDVARKGAELGCKEALLSLGDHPELRHVEMADGLRELGYASTPEYVAAMSELVLRETGLLPHTNCGTLDADEMLAIAEWNASMGIMLESTSLRLHEAGGAHYGTVTKRPEQRIATLDTAGKLGVAMTTGILIGIGETLEERVDSLIAIRDVHERHGNIQEVIVQNFRAKNATRMKGSPEPSTVDMLRTLAAARLVLGAGMNIQAPPNLNADGAGAYLLAGINDWGGISPLTKDFINPEAAWPEISRLRELTAEAGYELRERTALYPEYIASGWRTSSQVQSRIDEFTGSDGFVKQELES
ncbi:MAG: 7,8-didemethyl-8-hydroxy-5-deazariboflavin synthase CofG [Chloroflexi bacterium]|nr:7,8-didemethyl-8-hydroxy-5-deazariboflavin synthase CofG [Chloroflexota bacterium]